jgi:hypothetical protein
MARPASVAPPRKRAVQAVTVTAGRLTARGRMLPAFLIVGAQRGGTTSMYRTLSQHPAIVKAVLHKGVHYFDMAYDRKLSWYQGHFPLRTTGQRASRAAGAAAMTFESSPYYMFHPLAAGRIARDLPGVKLLVLVRDPVERAYSAHAHELARGYETEPFEAALALETGRLAGQEQRLIADPGYASHSHQHHAYRARGQYAEQLERLAGAVGRDRVHVVDSGDFFTKPEPVYDAVLDFLGLPDRGYPVFERHNARPRPAPMADGLRAGLDRHFRPWDEQLIPWLGAVPSWRR